MRSLAVLFVFFYFLPTWILYIRVSSKTKRSIINNMMDNLLSSNDVNSE